MTLLGRETAVLLRDVAICEPSQMSWMAAAGYILLHTSDLGIVNLLAQGLINDR